RVDNHPGIDFVTGVPITYTFGICQTLPCITPLICTITDPDTTCNDLFDTTGDAVAFAQGTPMALLGVTDDIFANTADVTWSVTYDKSFKQIEITFVTENPRDAKSGGFSFYRNGAT